MAYTGTLPVVKALTFGLLIFGLFAFNGLSVVVRRSRAAFFIVLVAGLIPTPGLLAQSIHFLRLLLTGDWVKELVLIITCGLALAQLIATILLLFFLMSCEVRNHVWRRSTR
jgi:hypothetical protein